jgi:trk system potassium uptake protein TrkA
MPKQYAVLGLGKFGAEVALQLASEGCEVLAVDKNPDLVDEVKDRVTRAAIADVTERANCSPNGGTWCRIPRW